MNRKKDIILTLTGILIGLSIGTPTAVAALTASPSTQTFYLDGEPIALTAYAINGNNYIKLRDIGRAVDFGVTYDGRTNSVYIAPDESYVEEGETNRKDVDLTTNEAIRQEMIRLINQVRRENGVEELEVNTSLMAAAQDCSAQGFTYHDTQYECETVLAYGYPHGVGSNLTVFTGVDTAEIAQHAVTNWVNSPGHFQTMIAEWYDCIGVGVTVVNGKAFCYMFVGNPNGHNPYE